MNRYHLATRTAALTLALSACAGEIAPPETRGAASTVSPDLPFGASAGLPPGAAGSGAAATTSAAGAKGRLNLAGSPQYFRVIALTKNQWRNSVRDILGLTTPPASAQAFQDAVSGTTDFTNNELVLDVDSRSWSDYQAAAEEVAHMVTADDAILGELYAGTDGSGFIASVGRRLFRRPLTAAEVSRLQPLFDMGAAEGGFASGAEMVLAAMLQAPQFLYRSELGQPGTALTGYEIAAKLSLWLRDTSPDKALLDAAESGELDTAQGVSAAASEMLEDPVAIGVMRQFHGQLLHLGRFAELSKVGVAAYDPAINSELMEAAYLFFDKVFSANRGLSDVFLSTSG
ncbi:MAG TPA: DUF1592 domain-containing protein, partial [Polyangiales bacterium]|nr:DUF1592 domain-containing protein [Polyangiales bacterium]